MTMISKPPVLDGVHIFDADTHITEVYDLWTSRAPAAYKARVPQVKDVNGTPTWVIEGDIVMGPAFPVSCIRRNGDKTIGLEMTRFKFEDAFAGAYDAKARVAYMDQHGITAQIAYPNLLGHGNQKTMGVDPELRLITTKIYNDFAIQFQRDSGNRIYPMVLLPWWDLKESLAETERCHKAGLRGVNISAAPQSLGLPVLSDDYWTPLWELCESLDMPVNFHTGGGFETSAWFGSGGWNTDNEVIKLAFGGSLLWTSNCQLIANIILSRMLERRPKLKMVSVESGVGWIPFLLETLDYMMKAEKIPHDMSPFEIFERNLYACCWFESRNLVHTARSIGVGNILIQTDFPHPVCQYPNTLEFMETAGRNFTAEERTKVLGGNAGRIYNVDLPSLG